MENAVVMARPLRIQRAGGWYHVTARGNERRDIFRDDRDRRHFLELLEQTVELFRWRLHAFVLMPNHYHQLIELTQPNLSPSVQWLNTSYSIWFNRRHGRSGHLFQGRFKSILVERESWGLGVSRYIHLNPVRVQRLGLGKGQVQRSRAVGIHEVKPEQVRERIAALRRYPWSSYRAYVGLAKVPPWLTVKAVLNLGGKAARKDEAYRKYCEEAVREGVKESPWEQVVGQAVLGSQRFVAQLRKSSPERRLKGDPGTRPTIDSIIALVERERGAKWEQFRDCYGDEGRDLVLYLGRRVCGMSFGELRQLAGIEYSSAAGAVRRFSERVSTDRRLSERVRKHLRQMNNE